MLPSNQSRITEHATFRYSPLHKAFEKQIKNLRSRKPDIKKLAIKDMILKNTLTEEAKNEL